MRVPWVYGVVQYDFNAERADELDAKAGEAIIVVAQSNPEWFVAKPIGPARRSWFDPCFLRGHKRYSDDAISARSP